MSNIEIKTPQDHITPPGHMTIVHTSTALTFITDLVGIKETLELGKVYNIELGKDIYLSPAEPLTLPKKVYDFEQDFRNQILTTLRHPEGNMNIGVLLEGYKGQGKSVIAKQLAIESGLPIIIVGKQIPKTYDIVSYLNQIKQDYVLLIDEFEKLFNEKDDNENKFHAQEVFLGFLDGTQELSNKRLVILTSNKKIGDKFNNRPGRIRYYKKFDFMSKKVFEAILDDKLRNQDFRDDLKSNMDLSNSTVDILTSVIEEINIHNKPFSEFKEIFNFREREVIYSRHRMEEDGTWKYIDEITTSREIGVENENYENVIGYHAKILKNTGNVIIYKLKDYINPDSEDDDESEKMKTFTFKITKQKSFSSKLEMII